MTEARWTTPEDGDHARRVAGVKITVDGEELIIAPSSAAAITTMYAMGGVVEPDGCSYPCPGCGEDRDEGSHGPGWCV